jgi:hypothetical protein
MHRIALLLSLVLFTGCDTMHGVRRYAPASRLPPPEEVRAIIASVPGVVKVDVKKIRPGRSFSLYDGIKTSADYDQFVISTNEVFTVLEIGQEKGKEVMFYSLWMHTRPPEEKIQKAVALMDQVYGALKARYPWLPAMSEFIETGKGPNQSLQPTAPSGRG